VLFAATAFAQAATAARQGASGQTPPEDSLARWLAAQAFAVSARYNHIEDGRERTLQNRLQTQVQFRAALLIDPAGRYRLHAGLATGSGFRSGWNSTGIGTGDGTARISLTQLFVSAEPVDGVAVEYGSLPPARGQSTEITTYDNDAYITAGRLRLHRPREAFFDDVIVSVGYGGYLDRPFVFDRTGAFSRQNYWQLLASKQVVSGLTVSTEYSEIEDDGMLRQGGTWRVDEGLVDSVRAEYGIRLRGGSHATAFAFSGEKQIARVTVEAGYAHVDPIFGVLNGDPYGAGNRVFADGSVALPLDLAASWFVQKEISPPVTSANGVRFDLVLRWNVLNALKRLASSP
jgi:hypothetical protein